MIQRQLAGVVIAFLFATTASADVLVYTDGHVLNGTLVSRDDKQVIFDCQRGPATVRLVLSPAEVENVRIEPLPQATTQPGAATPEATSPTDAFGAMQQVATQARGMLRPLPSLPKNATQAQRDQREAQQKAKWDEMCAKVVAIRDELNGRQLLVSGKVEDIVAKDGTFVVRLSRVAYTPPADMSRARSLAANSEALRRSARDALMRVERSVHDESSRVYAEQRKDAIRDAAADERRVLNRDAGNAGRVALAEARAGRLYHTIEFVTADPKIGSLTKGASLPTTPARIQETHLYLADGQEITLIWHGKDSLDKPLIVRCTAVAE